MKCKKTLKKVKKYRKQMENLKWSNNLALRILVFLAWNSWSHSNWNIGRIF